MARSMEWERRHEHDEMIGLIKEKREMIIADDSSSYTRTSTLMNSDEGLLCIMYSVILILNNKSMVLTI